MKAKDAIPSGSLIGKTPKIDDVRQGKVGSCYFMVGLAAIANNASLLQNTLVTQSDNKAGVLGIKFYIRGKPWVVTIDDYLHTDAKNNPIFARPDP